jgi:uncharacterized membrane protein YfcA
MDITTVTLLLVCGLLSGLMNTLASSGSAITLPAMIFLGVPPSMANATNRLPILVGSTISVYNFQRSKEIIWSKTLLTSIPLFFGVIVGSLWTKYMDSTKIQWILLVAMIFSFLLIVTNSRKILKGRSLIKINISIKNHVVFFLIGIWAGLIVLDSAILILFELILGCGFDLAKANPIKNFFLIIISFVSLSIFAFNGLINWEIGLILSVGSFFGGYWGSKIAHLEYVKKWIYRILIGIIVFEIITLAIKLFVH